MLTAMASTKLRSLPGIVTKVLDKIISCSTASSSFVFFVIRLLDLQRLSFFELSIQGKVLASLGCAFKISAPRFRKGAFWVLFTFDSKLSNILLFINL